MTISGELGNCYSRNIIRRLCTAAIIQEIGLLDTSQLNYQLFTARPTTIAGPTSTPLSHANMIS